LWPKIEGHSEAITREDRSKRLGAPADAAVTDSSLRKALEAEDVVGASVLLSNVVSAAPNIATNAMSASTFCRLFEGSPAVINQSVCLNDSGSY
jgi:hypothetical protein